MRQSRLMPDRMPDFVTALRPGAQEELQFAAIVKRQGRSGGA
jgi:hypothetical protein